VNISNVCFIQVVNGEMVIVARMKGNKYDLDYFTSPYKDFDVRELDKP
jgi:hypothetical protein